MTVQDVMLEDDDEYDDEYAEQDGIVKEGSPRRIRDTSHMSIIEEKDFFFGWVGLNNDSKVLHSKIHNSHNRKNTA